MGYKLIENEVKLRKDIYKNLPYGCKSAIANFGVGIGCFFSGGVEKEVDDSTKQVIDDIYNRCLKYYSRKIMANKN